MLHGSSKRVTQAASISTGCSPVQAQAPTRLSSSKTDHNIHLRQAATAAAPVLFQTTDGKSSALAPSPATATKHDLETFVRLSHSAPQASLYSGTRRLKLLFVQAPFQVKTLCDSHIRKQSQHASTNMQGCNFGCQSSHGHSPKPKAKEANPQKQSRLVSVHLRYVQAEPQQPSTGFPPSPAGAMMCSTTLVKQAVLHCGSGNRQLYKNHTHKITAYYNTQSTQPHHQTKPTTTPALPTARRNPN